MRREGANRGFRWVEGCSRDESWVTSLDIAAGVGFRTVCFRFLQKSVGAHQDSDLFSCGAQNFLGPIYGLIGMIDALL